MLGKKKTGSTLADSAIGEFEKIAADIEAGVAHNEDTIRANYAQIDRLDTANADLHAANARGKSVAAKPRELIGG